MKKSFLLVALPAVALTGLMLSGCSMFRSHKAWNTAQQESPLEIPPNLDRPATSDALVIPPRGQNLPTANGAIATEGAADGQVSDGFVLSDAVDRAYSRVGQALNGGSLGQVVAHDDAAHSYTVAVTGVSAMQKKGFFSRLFGHHKDKGDGATHQVQVSVSASGTGASEVRAQGDAAAVAKVVDSLRSSLGG
jgi:uncharacterized lipoprotein